MAGRGRGGKTNTFTHEQMQALGCVGKEIPQVATAPPPTYPLLATKPVVLQTTSAELYQIAWKENFLKHMRDSPYFLSTEHLKIKPDSWGEKNEVSFKMKAPAEFNYQFMPSELLLTGGKRRHDHKPKLVAKKPNIEDTLKALEEKEKREKNDDTEERRKRNTDSEGEEEEPEAETALDDEMDEENDYGNSYFDNGESYNDEDDNLDDGPIY